MKILILGVLLSQATFNGGFPASGTAVGAKSSVTGKMVPLKVDGTGALVTVSGGSAPGGGLTDTELRATAVPVSLTSVPSHGVTGTFWQTTQPVSGTFWQATQPVSLATAPTTPVTGTFWQATQPVSGTFYQATQPVSVAATLSSKIVKVAANPLSTAISVGATATLLPGSVLTNRVSLCIYNNGAQTIFLGASGVTTANGLPLPAGGAFCDDVGSQPYYGIVASSTADARVLEN
jgi:hypothetical protein